METPCSFLFEVELALKAAVVHFQTLESICCRGVSHALRASSYQSRFGNLEDSPDIHFTHIDASYIPTLTFVRLISGTTWQLQALKKTLC